MVKRKHTELSPLDLREVVIRNVGMHGPLCKTHLEAMNHTFRDYDIICIALFGLGSCDISTDTAKAYGLPTRGKKGEGRDILQFFSAEPDQRYLT